MLTLQTGHIIGAFTLKSIHFCSVLFLDGSNLIGTLLLEVSRVSGVALVLYPDFLSVTLVFGVYLTCVLSILSLNFISMSLVPLF